MARALVYVLVAVFTFFGTAALVYRVYELRNRHPIATLVGEEKYFAILVLTWEDSPKNFTAAVVMHKHLKRYLEQHPHHTFRIEREQVPEVNRQIWDTGRDEEGIYRYSKVSVLSSDSQEEYIELSAVNDTDYVCKGWYRVRGDTVTPDSELLYLGPSLGMLAGPIAILVTLIVLLGLNKIDKARFY